MAFPAKMHDFERVCRQLGTDVVREVLDVIELNHAINYTRRLPELTNLDDSLKARIRRIRSVLNNDEPYKSCADDFQAQEIADAL